MFRSSQTDGFSFELFVSSAQVLEAPVAQQCTHGRGGGGGISSKVTVVKGKVRVLRSLAIVLPTVGIGATIYKKMSKIAGEAKSRSSGVLQGSGPSRCHTFSLTYFTMALYVVKQEKSGRTGLL